MENGGIKVRGQDEQGSPLWSQGQPSRETCPDKPTRENSSFSSQASSSQHNHNLELSKTGLCKL